MMVSRRIRIRVLPVLFTTALALLFAAAAPVPRALATASRPTLALQFQAANHILAFQPERAYLASADHALTVDYLGTAGVQPLTARGTLPSLDPSSTPRPLSRVSYPDLWPGITLHYDPVAAGIGDVAAIVESTYTVAPGAPVSAIRFRYNVPVELGSDGSLQFLFPSARGLLTESAPIAWQEIDGARVAVPVAFALFDDNQVGFGVPAYDSRYPLTIDPIYAWHTFYGGTNNDVALGMALDSSGNIYVTGRSSATWNGPASQPPLNPFLGGQDLYILKLNSSGAYQWHTFYGSGADEAHGIASDASGNIYIVGLGSDWKGPNNQNPKLPHSAGSLDAIVLKLDSAGTYQWHTYFGKEGAPTYAYAVALDSASNVLVTGMGPEFSAPSSPLNAFPGTASNIFVLKLNSSGVYQWHTFYGSSNDVGSGIATDTVGNIYVAASANAAWNGPGVGDTPLHAHGGGIGDLAVLKLNSDGGYLWHTFYGSTDYEYDTQLTVDSTGSVIVVGASGATWNGPGSTPPLHEISTPHDGVVLKLNSDGAYQWHTFYGGTGTDRLNAVTTDQDGNIYTTGYSFNIGWNGPAGQPPLHALTGFEDILVLKLNSAGAYQWHGFYGSSGSDEAYTIALQSNGDISLAATSGATWTVPDASPLNGYAGGNADITVLKLTRLATTTGLSSSANPSTLNQSITLTATVGGSGGTPTGTVTFKEGSTALPGCSARPLASGQATCSLSSLGVGTHSITAYYNGDNDYGLSASSALSQVVNKITTTTAITSHDPSPSTVGQAVTVHFTVTPGSSGGTLTGNVTVSAGATNCMASASAGSCSLVLNTAGSDNITAAYSGDSNYAASTSAPQAHVVNKISTTTTITTHGPNPSSVGQAVTVHYTVTVNAPGSGTPTGTVTVGDGMASCTAAVAAGSCSLTLNTAGAHTHTATYNGDASFAASTSSAMSHTVAAPGVNLYLPLLLRAP